MHNTVAGGDGVRKAQSTGSSVIVEFDSLASLQLSNDVLQQAATMRNKTQSRGSGRWEIVGDGAVKTNGGQHLEPLDLLRFARLCRVVGNHLHPRSIPSGTQTTQDMHAKIQVNLACKYESRLAIQLTSASWQSHLRYTLTATR